MSQGDAPQVIKDKVRDIIKASRNGDLGIMPIRHKKTGGVAWGLCIMTKHHVTPTGIKANTWPVAILSEATLAELYEPLGMLDMTISKPI